MSSCNSWLQLLDDKQMFVNNTAVRRYSAKKQIHWTKKKESQSISNFPLSFKPNKQSLKA